jgi:2-polyprenyl-3-methyl-5-hydroxy-6-metoxy-1,4-benzoquinol methylase
MTDRVTFSDVVEGWRVAPVTAIHPLRHVSDEAYWQSGRQQALDAAQWLDEGASLMDFGCGDGRVAIPLVKLGFTVYAVDASDEMIERLKREAKAQDARETLHTWVSDGMGHYWPEAIGQLDAVHCRAVLIHHSHKDVAELVTNFAKCLKPGGVLIADWPVGDHYERQNWTDVTTWLPKHRAKVAEAAGFSMLHPGTDAHGSPSVWRKL